MQSPNEMYKQLAKWHHERELYITNLKLDLESLEKSILRLPKDHNVAEVTRLKDNHLGVMDTWIHSLMQDCDRMRSAVHELSANAQTPEELKKAEKAMLLEKKDYRDYAKLIDKMINELEGATDHKLVTKALEYLYLLSQQVDKDMVINERSLLANDPGKKYDSLIAKNNEMIREFEKQITAFNTLTRKPTEKEQEANLLKSEALKKDILKLEAANIEYRGKKLELLIDECKESRKYDKLTIERQNLSVELASLKHSKKPETMTNLVQQQLEKIDKALSEKDQWSASVSPLQRIQREQEGSGRRSSLGSRPIAK